MQYQLLKSRRKTIAISFDRDGNLIVKAPLWAGDKEIDCFVESKTEWILAAREKIKNEKEKKDARRLRLENGECVYFLGEKRLLTIIREERNRAKIVCVGDRLLLHIPYKADYEYKRETLIKWYRREAVCVICGKAKAYGNLLGVSYGDIRIKDQKSRWGSCSSCGNLNFNWRILMAPEPVCDYVIIHELCHLVYMNHSADFWNLVERVCPEYRQYKKWLRENEGQLYLF